MGALRTVSSADPTFVELVAGQDRGPWVNAHFETPDLAGLWRRLRARLAATGLLAGTIVTCQGEDGWDDYLLLHHHDRGVRVRRLA